MYTEQQKQSKDMEEPEHIWLAQYRQGDIEALGLLVEHFRRPLYGFILRMIPSPQEADEIFQEVWFRAIRGLDRYKDQRFLSWLFRIARNLVIDRARKKRPELSMQGDAQGEHALEEVLYTEEPDPGIRAGGRELATRIRQAVDRLPPEQKEVFLLRSEGGISFKEIATLQGCSINTALGRMHYATTHLREDLKDEYEEIKQLKD